MLLAMTLSAAAAPTVARAQDTRVDSLEARIKELEARLDSLLAAIARGERAGRPAERAAAELEALRAAARAAAGAPGDTTPAQESRTRNLNILNPEISVTGDFVGSHAAPSGESNTTSAVPREFEFSFQAALDPYTHTKIFVSHEEDFEIAGFPEEDGAAEEGGGAVEIEEGYLYWVGLPARLGLKVGKFRQEIGLYNRWHTHALLEVERPLPTVAFLGEDGLIQTGVAVTLPTLSRGASTNTLSLELTRGDNDALFAGGNEISFLGRVQSFWDLSPSSYVQFGATGVYGENGEESLISRLLQLDASYRWTPAGRSTYRDFGMKAEWYFVNRDIAAADGSANGGYVQASYRLDRRWILGGRADFLDDFGTEPKIYQLVPSVTWWQSEWVRLRLQYHFLKPAGGDGNHTVLFQTVWAVGPHKHETY